MQRTEILDAFERQAHQPLVNMKFKIRYMENGKVVHQVEVRNVNYLDVKRHLEEGDIVEIIPEPTDQATKYHNHTERPFYVPHV